MRMKQQIFDPQYVEFKKHVTWEKEDNSRDYKPILTSPGFKRHTNVHEKQAGGKSKPIVESDVYIYLIVTNLFVPCLAQ